MLQSRPAYLCFGAPVSDPARIMGMARAGSETGAPDPSFTETLRQDGGAEGVKRQPAGSDAGLQAR